jgi:hypothetical protein
MLLVTSYEGPKAPLSQSAHADVTPEGDKCTLLFIREENLLQLVLWKM